MKEEIYHFFTYQFAMIGTKYHVFGYITIINCKFKGKIRQRHRCPPYIERKRKLVFLPSASGKDNPHHDLSFNVSVFSIVLTLNTDFFFEVLANSLFNVPSNLFILFSTHSTCVSRYLQFQCLFIQHFFNYVYFGFVKVFFQNFYWLIIIP